MLKLKLLYFGHLMCRADLLEKTRAESSTMGLKWWLAGRCPGSCTGEPINHHPRLFRTNWGKQNQSGTWERCREIRFSTVNDTPCYLFTPGRVVQEVERGTWAPPVISSPFILIMNSLCHTRHKSDLGLLRLIGRGAEFGGNLVPQAASRTHRGTFDYQLIASL